MFTSTSPVVLIPIHILFLFLMSLSLVLIQMLPSSEWDTGTTGHGPKRHALTPGRRPGSALHRSTCSVQQRSAMASTCLQGVVTSDCDCTRPTHMRKLQYINDLQLAVRKEPRDGSRRYQIYVCLYLVHEIYNLRDDILRFDTA